MRYLNDDIGAMGPATFGKTDHSESLEYDDNDHEMDERSVTMLKDKPFVQPNAKPMQFSP